MRNRALIVFSSLLLFACLAEAAEQADTVKTDTVTISAEQQYDNVLPGGESALAIHFKLKKNWHFYASQESAPAGTVLKVTPETADGVVFKKPIFPKSKKYFDKSSNRKLEVFSDNFTVYIPFAIAEDVASDNISISVAIYGAVCSDVQCRMPDFGKLGTVVNIRSDAVMGNEKFALPAVTLDSRFRGNDRFSENDSVGSTNQWAGYSVWFALGLAFVAGLALNIMPCVWPVLPLIVMRIVEHGKESKARAMSMGFAFCFGILLFFASLAATNVLLQLAYGTVLQWGDQFRNPAFVCGMAMLLIVMAFFMFGMFTVSLPSSIAGKQGSGKGYAGSVGMGFLAAILSTPCSFGILAAAFAWAQVQPLMLGTSAILVIGVGMAMPYLILTSMPKLLNRIPKAGRWMELFKEAIGFILLIIAVKLIAALPQDRRMSVLYFSVILGFGVWMWGGWVNYGTKLSHKIIVRGLAMILTIAAGILFLSGPKQELIAWQDYDAGTIESSLKNKQPVLIKFTADWCLSCQVVEKRVFSQKDIAELLEKKGVITIKADTTTRDMPATDALKNIYNEPGVPVTMLLVPGTDKSVRWRGMSFGAELKEQLESLTNK